MFVSGAGKTKLGSTENSVKDLAYEALQKALDHVIPSLSRIENGILLGAEKMGGP